jgi:putative tricarboxylic transport membrane protein
VAEGGVKPAGQVSPAWPEVAIGVGLLAFAAIVLYQIYQIPVSPLYAKVGPRVLPFMTAGGLAILALLLILAGLRGGWQPEEEKAIPPDWRAIGFVVAGLILNVLLIGPLGFTAASTILFVLVAYGFGSRQVLRNAALGFAVSLAAYFGFARALGVNIGAGIVERLLGG